MTSGNQVLECGGYDTALLSESWTHQMGILPTPSKKNGVIATALHIIKFIRNLENDNMMVENQILNPLNLCQSAKSLDKNRFCV